MLPTDPRRAADTLINYSFLALTVIYALWATHELSRVTIWASAVVVVSQQLWIPVGRTHLWHSFAAWAEGIARADELNWSNARTQACVARE